eukprot:gnl/Dysnectes_brevis/3681_a4705_752.p1 GENE.gnl/Dysnectes_brevis/3681_a4705_752~~gnl/Dysnectes_brevis/3681_a4705_752.p1  ORF type:complete len:890 (+),score=375.07 gnl/Dysnectes_brevis/3681_a4705_752:172-2670(+)
MAALAEIFSSESADPSLRQQAGLQLKNMLQSTDSARRKTKAFFWNNLPETARKMVKDAAQQQLVSSFRNVSSAAAQVISQIARIELPQGKWDDLLPNLAGGIKTSSDKGRTYSLLVCLRFVLEEFRSSLVETPFLTRSVTSILEAVIGASTPDNPQQVVESALGCISAAMPFAEEAMTNPPQRIAIFQPLLYWAQQPQLAPQALEALTVLADEHYSTLSLEGQDQRPHVQSIFEVTMAAIGGTEQEACLHAMNFWIALARVELENEGDGESKNFLGAVLKWILPAILAKLPDSSELDLQDSESAAFAQVRDRAATLLSWIARVCRNPVLQSVKEFADQHVASEDWFHRDAALLAMGCVLDGPERTPMLSEVVGILLNLSGQILTRSFVAPPLLEHTAAWALSRIAQFHPEMLRTRVPDVMGAANSCLLNSDAPAAAQMCWALNYLAQDFQKQDNQAPMQPYVVHCISAVLSVSLKFGGSNPRLNSATYNCMPELVLVVDTDRIPALTEVMTHTCTKLTALSQQLSTGSPDDPATAAACNLVEQFCAFLGYSARRLGMYDGWEAGRGNEVFDVVVQTVGSLFSTSAAKDDGVACAGADCLGYLCANPKISEFLQPMLNIVGGFMSDPQRTDTLFDMSNLLQSLLPVITAEDALKAVDLALAAWAHLNTPLKARASLLSCFSDLLMAHPGQVFEHAGRIYQCVQGAAGITVESIEDIENIQALRQSVAEVLFALVIGGQRTSTAPPFGSTLMQITGGLKNWVEDEDISLLELRTIVCALLAEFLEIDESVRVAARSDPTWMMTLATGVRSQEDEDCQVSSQALIDALRNSGVQV